MSDGPLRTPLQINLKIWLSPTHSPKEILGRASAAVWKASLNWTQPIQVGLSLKSIRFPLKHAVSNAPQNSPPYGSQNVRLHTRNLHTLTRSKTRQAYFSYVYAAKYMYKITYVLLTLKKKKMGIDSP